MHSIPDMASSLVPPGPLRTQKLLFEVRYHGSNHGSNPLTTSVVRT